MTSDFAAAVSVPDDEIDLARAALLYARDVYSDLNPKIYLIQLDAWANAIRSAVESHPNDTLTLLNDLLFGRLGFHGNTADYFDPKNSYLNEVIDRRTGLPILLSTVYLEVGWRLGLPLSGVGLPGHFIVRHDPSEQPRFVDPFNQGRLLTASDCAQLVQSSTGSGAPFNAAWLHPVSKRQMLTRMLNNLRSTYIQAEKFAETRPVMERLVELDPASAENVRDLGLVLFRLGTYRQAIDRLESYFALQPGASDIDSIRQVIAAARTEMNRWN
jgi:regulator of sirC expression with transglutaminase-like and TPR domain